jgi:sarcosine oxidase subunit alpha
MVRNNGGRLEGLSVSACSSTQPIPCFHCFHRSVPETCSITVNGKTLRVSAATSVAAAILNAGEPTRISLQGEPRGPLCGMGICMECRATVNGVAHARTCHMVCEPGMEVVTA